MPRGYSGIMPAFGVRPCKGGFRGRVTLPVAGVTAACGAVLCQLLMMRSIGTNRMPSATCSPLVGMKPSR